MFTDNLVKPIDKPNGLPDYNFFLRWLWGSDKSRPWEIYSKKTFSRFWDDRNSVDVEVRHSK